MKMSYALAHMQVNAKLQQERTIPALVVDQNGPSPYLAFVKHRLSLD